MIMATVARLGLLALVGLTVLQVPARAVDSEAVNRAIDNGVAGLRGLQGGNGTWPHDKIGATALAGLTLLECGVASDDKAVLEAARAVRAAGIPCTHTYSIALAILFLDRLGDRGDVALIESLTVRLLAGQGADGGWTYQCPEISDDEVRRLATHLKKTTELVGRRELPRPGTPRRTVNDLPLAIQAQLQQISRRPPEARGAGGSDNSNTQFALLGLWVARRYGMPVERALARVDRRFRASRIATSGWGYKLGQTRATGTMTCAALLGLAVAHGVAIESGGKPKNPIARDGTLRGGLNALGGILRRPVDASGDHLSQIHEGQYYFLWSLERVCVTLGLATVAKVDWYNWGAEYLLTKQGPDGTWNGAFGGCGADTCFALLFLKRSNLVSDLTAQIKGKVEDPGEAVLRAGGLGLPGGDPPAEDPQPEPAPAPAGGIEKPLRPDPDAPPRPKPTPRPAAPPLGEGAAGRLAADLLRASEAERTGLLEKLRDGKGPDFTEALAGAIVRLEGEAKTQARDALARRLARMKAETLGEYLKDEEPEVRRAAAVACGRKGLKAQVPALIGLLRDPQDVVARAAHDSLKALTGQSFGLSPVAWEAWWKTQGKD
jgi:hypothetical protein